MGASTAGVLSFKSILYSQDLVLARMFRAYFSFIDYTNLHHRSFSFSRATPFGVWGGPEKDRNVCVFVVGTLCMLSPDSSCQQDVLWHDGNSPGMDGTQVGIIKQPDKVCLRCFLETQYRCQLEPQVHLEVLGDLPYQPAQPYLYVVAFTPTLACSPSPKG